MNKKRFILVGSSVLAGLLTVSCTAVISNPESAIYPASWDKPNTMVNADGACPSVSGTYKNQGDVSASDIEYLPTLDGAILSRLPLHGNSTYVELDYDVRNEVMKIRLLDADSEPVDDTSSFSFDNFGCENGWLVHYAGLKGYVDGTYHTGSEKLLFAKSNDHLVVHQYYDLESTSLFIFNAGKNGEIWYRFEAQ